METGLEAITEFDKGQKENSSQNNVVVLGMPGTGKNYLTFDLKEHGLRKQTIKLFEYHATKPTHLAEILELLFPNGFHEKLEAMQTLKTAVKEFKKGNYTDSPYNHDDIEELLNTIREKPVGESVPKARNYLENEENKHLKPRFKQVVQNLEAVQERLQETQDWLVTNDAVPMEYRENMIGDRNNYSFSINVFTPITHDMPTSPVPDFFRPFAVPVDDFQKHDLEWSLKVIHGDNHESFNRIYYSSVRTGETTLADLKNIEELGSRAYASKIKYGGGDEVEVTKAEPEKNQIKAFRKRWDNKSRSSGVFCNPGFKHRLRPKLKDAILSDEPEVVVLYTGFIRDRSVRKFVITYFLETYRDIVENLSGKDVGKLDRKFICSAIEAQEVVKEGGRGRRLSTEDRMFNKFIREAMNDSRHFNTDFWFDFKADEAHDMVLSKSDLRIVTRMDIDTLDDYKSWDSYDELKKAFTDDYYDNQYGFVFLKDDEVPVWKYNGRNMYGHRLPGRRMTVESPVDAIGGNDFSFFTELLPELGYDVGTIDFKDFQDMLFKEDWQESEGRYLEKYDKQEQQKQEKAEEEKAEKLELIKENFRTKLEKRFEGNGGRKPSKGDGGWRKWLNEIADDMDLDKGIKTYENWTQDFRAELEDREKENQAEEYGFEWVEQVAEELVQMKRFVFGDRSKKKKLRTAEKHILKNYDVSKSVAGELAADVRDEAESILQSAGVMSSRHDPEISEEEFFEWVDTRFSDTVDSSDTSEGDNEGDDVDEDNGGDDGSGSELEPPGEDWMCSCGTFNEEDRVVCRNCTKSYEEAEKE